ncbi:translation initiation factor IF-2-like [Oenanthe melanoleuca]|uniref:translation initiation factor IF-2-like n=1 Tax=Oenanthe melanoleuca TaxID=2939378 RepID=UPI0024C18EDB|nr:translation initiation factor IF-2-like [Oenanthe melanoleuca]
MPPPLRPGRSRALPAAALPSPRSAHRALAPSHPAGPSAAPSLARCRLSPRVPSPGGARGARRAAAGAPRPAERSGAEQRERSGARAGTPRRRRGAPARPAGTTAPPAPAAPRLHRQPARRPHTKSQHSMKEAGVPIFTLSPLPPCSTSLFCVQATAKRHFKGSCRAM